MLFLMERINRAVVAVEAVAAGSLVVGVFVTVLVQVIMRYLFQRSNPWSEELSRFFLIWLSMLGASMAVEMQSHFAFDQVLARMSGRSRDWARFAQLGLLTLAAAGLTVLGILLLTLAAGQRSAALDLPMAWVYASVPTSGILMLLHLAGRLDKMLMEARGRAGNGLLAS
jgi:TRAP-type C4-dicarboxylate transport system permease small subunit